MKITEEGQMRGPRKSPIATVTGFMIMAAVLAYGSTAAVSRTTTAGYRATAAKKRATKAEKLAKALKACKKDKTKSKRKACETKANKLYGKTKPKTEHHETTTTTGTATTTGTGTTGTATTGTGTTAGTTTGTTKETPQQEKERTPTTMPAAALVAGGKALFAEQCASCHGPNGEGTAHGPELNSTPRAHSMQGVILQLIEPEGEMPNFDKTFTYQQKEELAAFVTVDLTHSVEEAH